MDKARLTVGYTYEVFNPKYGTFTGKLVELSAARDEAVIRHDVAGQSQDTACNLAYCTLTAN